MENGGIPTVEQTPKVSVIIPIYNAEKYLRQCLDSVVNQTLREIEIICVDDGSTDGSLAILQEYAANDARIKVLTQKNQYAGVARNNGMAAATGEYYAFMDADDYYAENALASMYNIAAEHELDVLKAAFYNIEPNKAPYDTKYSTNGALNPRAISTILSFPENIDDLVLVSDIPWNGLYRASFIQSNKILFNNLRCINDRSFYINCIICAPRLMVTGLHVAYHRVSQSGSLVGTKSKYFQCQIDSFNIIKKLTSTLPLMQKRTIMQREIDGMLHWYKKLRAQASAQYASKMDEQMHTFIKDFNENDVGIKHLLTMYDSDLYYQLKDDVLHGAANGDPRFPCAVSIIVPVYNAEQYLDDCLSSLCGQSFSNIEIICVDDKSSDNSLSILKSYAEKDARIIVVAQKENTHQGGARNAGLDIARGKYIWFIDADDYIDLDAVERLVEMMESLSDVDLLSFNCDAFIEINGVKTKAETGQIRRIWPKNRKIHLPADAKMIPAAIDGSSCTYFSKRAFIDSFRYRPHIFYEDAAFTFQALTSPGVFYEIDYAPYHRRIHAASSTNQGGQLSTKSITDRIIALQDISNVIHDRCLPQNGYAVTWFKSWGRHCISAYIERDLQFPAYDNAIESLQTEWRFFADGLPISVLKLKRPFPIIVSLTSYPPRIQSVYKTTETLLNQTLKADKVVLWLAEEEFPNKEKDLPAELIAQTQRGLEIAWCHNIRSYKKLIPALKAYPDAVLVTTDDDNYYHPDWLEKLYRAYLNNPDCIQCHRITKVALDRNGEFVVFPGGKDFWRFPSYLNKLVGAGGVLYPPHCFHPDVLDEEKFMTLAPTSDDIWFWLMAALAGYRVNVVPNNIVKLDYVEGTQDCALCLINDHGENYFWVHFKNILKAYPQVECRLRVAYQEALRITAAPASPAQGVPQSNYHAEQAEQEIRNIRASASYRIGRFITWIPRMVRGFFRCYQEHGAGYTWQRVLFHLHMQKKPASAPISSSAPAGAAVKAIFVKKNYNYYRNLTPSQYPAELCEWFKRTTGQNLDLENPKTFNEKLQWLKLYDSTPLKTRLADKYLVRDWVKEKIGEEYLIPLLGVWDSFDEIDFDALPNQFVLKANHGCGWNIIVTDKSKFDKADAKKKFDSWMKLNFAYSFGLELQYLNIPPKIIAEAYVENAGNDLYDYKVFCFNGKAESIMFLSERKTGLKMAFYDLQWNKLPFTYSFPRNPEDIPKPQNLDLLISLAEKLSEGFAHVRVDFYILNDGTLKFGEMTFTSASGSCKWNPPEQNRIYGDLITLPPKSPIPQKLI